jgi:hypothetical protein
MGQIKNAIMWLEENGYEASNENLHLVPLDIEPPIRFKLEASQNPDNLVWSVAVISKDVGMTAIFVSLIKELAVRDAADYIEYKSR